MNVLLLVVDSLRRSSLALDADDGEAEGRRAGRVRGLPRTPFLSGLGARSTSFSRAYAAECWTLPSHLSMFTGQLPREHGAHFRTMAYTGRAPTLAELCAGAGFHTELVTRNSLFDGTVPGATRGFARCERPLAEMPRGASALLLVLALAKPRVRRLIRTSSFFHRRQKESVEFLMRLARMGLPADRLALGRVLETMAEQRRAGRPYFVFANLYDVHAPYCPTEGSPLRPLGEPGALLEALALPWVLPKVSGHGYLRAGFRLGRRSREMLLGRYHRAIELMDEKLEWFWGEAERAGLLEDTVVVVTSDHGEAFGEHGLYLHDASVYETHLRVPLWVMHPEVAPGRVDDVVSTRDLFALLVRCALGRKGWRASGAADGLGRDARMRSDVAGGVAHALRGTLLDAGYRARHGAALAEHIHYPHGSGVLARYRQDQAAVITQASKHVARGAGLERYDLECDPGEEHPVATSLGEAEATWRREGLGAAAIERAVRHLGRAGQAGRAGHGGRGGPSERVGRAA